MTFLFSWKFLNKKLPVSKGTWHLIITCHIFSLFSIHSTVLKLLVTIKVINDLLVFADAGALNILLMLDRSAAFDTVSRSVHLSMLHKLGIDGTALGWFTFYLTNRQLFVSLSGQTFSSSAISRGVPQESVLGPLLFIVYILPIRHTTLLDTSWFSLLCGTHQV